eukprot:GFUD01073571.1.p1 GENE.GFUD01073571.1~~GFUD01073571.1.p1  ORF type:complete len:304 (-),score=89.29 GFUD01073571.1:26-937(-)
MEAVLDMMQDRRVEVADMTKVQSKLQQIISGGPDHLQFIVDFDYTLSRAHKDGKLVDCSWGVLENFQELPSDYHKKVKVVKDKYYPIEIDMSISLEKKIPIMIEWYKKANGLLSESGVNRSWFPRMVAESNCELRDDTHLLLNRLNHARVPVLVLSAGLGDLISHIMSHFGVLHGNTTLVSNFLDYDQEGKVVGLKEDDGLIHMYNKSESILKRSQGDNYADRKNVVLLGDSLGDLKMADGVKDPNVVLTVGFLNKNIEESLETYKKSFDIVLVDDQTMDFPNALVTDVLKVSAVSVGSPVTV